VQLRLPFDGSYDDDLRRPRAATPFEHGFLLVYLGWKFETPESLYVSIRILGVSKFERTVQSGLSNGRPLP
jgi:hypothetical protein